MKSYIVINAEDTKFLTATEQASLANILRALEHSRRLRGEGESVYTVTAATPTTSAGEDGELLELVAAERARQVSAEGWTPEHDDDHNNGELADAAACYALNPDNRKMIEAIIPGSTRLPESLVKVPRLWPWDAEWWKPTPMNREREIIKACALLIAEAARLRRAAKSNSPK